MKSNREVFDFKVKLGKIIEEEISKEFDVEVNDILNDEVYIIADKFLSAFIDKCNKHGLHTNCTHCDGENCN